MWFTRKMPLCLVFALVSGATAQTLQIENVIVSPQLGFGVTVHYEARMTAPLPASFPRPASRVELQFNCTEGLRFAPGTSESEAAAFLTYSKLTARPQAPYDAVIGNVALSCPGNRLTVASAQLQRLWTGGEKAETLRRAVSLTATPSRWLAFSADGQALVWRAGGKVVVLSMAGKTLKVLDGDYGAAVAVTQAGKTMPIWVSGAPSKSVPYNPSTALTISVTADEGAVWDNVTLEPGRTRAAFWQSATNPAGAAPGAQP